MQTTRGISAATASSIPAAARGGLGDGQHEKREWTRVAIRHEDRTSIGSSLFHAVCDAREDWLSEMCLSCFFWICS